MKLSNEKMKKKIFLQKNIYINNGLLNILLLKSFKIFLICNYILAYKNRFETNFCS